MMRRSCAIYATGTISAVLLFVGILLVVFQVFPTMIHDRLKQVSCRLYGWSFAPTFPHFVTFRGFGVPLQTHADDGSRPRCGLVFISTCVQLFLFHGPFSLSLFAGRTRFSLRGRNPHDWRLCDV